MSEAEQLQSVIDVIVPHPARPQILVDQTLAQWHLPRLALDQIWQVPIGAINNEMQRLFGLETTVLRLIAEQRAENTPQIYMTYLLENHQVDWSLPSTLRWVGRAELDEMTFAYAQQRAAIEAYLGEVEIGVTPPLRVPWARPGWQRATERWIRTHLAQLDYPVAGAIEPIKNWVLSCVMRVPTERGQVYFKVTHASALMVNEAKVTQALGRLFPYYMPKSIGIEPELGWMLLADFGQEVGWSASVEIRAEVLRDFARLQIASATQIDALLAIGCIDRRLPKLAEQIDPLLNDTEIMVYIEPEKQQQLRVAAPKLKALCQQLDQYHVPTTLVHGDMHMSNVARRAATDFDTRANSGANSDTGQYLFFDWTDACLAHPFLDMIDILHERDATTQIQLRDSYLAMWTAYEPTDRLLDMWQIANPLCALHQAVSYRYILLNTEAACRHEMAGSIPFWFGKLLEALDALPIG